MFIMVSSSCFQVPPPADGHLGGQLACAVMYDGVFSTIVNITKGSCECCFGNVKGFYIELIEDSVGYSNSHHNHSQPWYFQHDDIADIDVVVFTLSAPVRQIQGQALCPYIMVDVAVP